MDESAADPGPRVPGDGSDVIEALLGASRALVAMAARSIAELDDTVTLPQFRALVVLAMRGPQRVADISAELGIGSSTATRLAERLTRKRLVRRTRSRRDRRVVLLTLTPRGQDLVDQVIARRRAELDRVVAVIPRRWHPALVEALTAFTAASGEDEDGQWWLGWVEGQGEPDGDG